MVYHSPSTAAGHGVRLSSTTTLAGVGGGLKKRFTAANYRGKCVDGRGLKAGVALEFLDVQDS